MTHESILQSFKTFLLRHFWHEIFKTESRTFNFPNFLIEPSFS